MVVQAVWELAAFGKSNPRIADRVSSESFYMPEIRGSPSLKAFHLLIASRGEVTGGLDL